MEQNIDELKGTIGKIKTSLNDLVPSKGKKIKNEGTQIQFLIQQLDSVISEVDNLDRAVALGIPLTEYEGNLSKLLKVEREMKSVEEKMKGFMGELHEVRKQEDELGKLLQEGISERQVKILEGRIKNLEELQEKLLSSRSTKVVMELVQIIDMLNKRVKSLEEVVKVAKEESQEGKIPIDNDFEKKGLFSEIFDFLKRD